jgi:hypothetical protein
MSSDLPPLLKILLGIPIVALIASIPIIFILMPHSSRVSNVVQSDESTSIYPRGSQEAILGAATAKLDRGLPLNQQEMQAITDKINGPDKRRAEMIERQYGER